MPTNAEKRFPLLATKVLTVEGGVEEAARMYDKSIVGERLTTVSTRWAEFVLEYDAARWADAEREVEEVLKQNTTYTSAIAMKARFGWFVRGRVNAARDIAKSGLEDSPNDPALLATATYIELLLDNPAGARSFLIRLRRKTQDRTIVMILEGMLSLTEGRPLALAEESFRIEDSLEARINLAVVLCGKGDDEACGRMLAECEGPLSVPNYADVTVARAIIADGWRASSGADVDARAHADRVMWRALARHTEVPPSRRQAINRAIKGVL